jgi:hypothetical protein
METTQGKAVLAYTTLAQMSRKPMPSFAAYKLFRLKKALSPVVEFQSEQEMKLVDELGGKITEAGMIQIDGADKRKEYAEKHRELEAMACEIDLEKITMTMKELPELSVADMETLDDFVTWKE